LARKEARIFVSIWDDRDFTNLLAVDQRWFFFLISQARLSHAGVLPLGERRWAKSCADGGTEMDASLKRLEAARFVVIDRDEEELLIRSHMRQDQVYLQPNLMRAAAASIATITSPAIIDALFWEITRIEQEQLTENQAAAVATMVKALSKRAKDLGITRTDKTPQKPLREPIAEPFQEGIPEPIRPEPIGEPFPEPIGEPLRREGVVTASTTDNPSPLDPFSSTLTPSPSQTLVDLPADASVPKQPRADPNGFDEFWSIYPRREAQGAARKAWAKAVKTASVEEVLAGARAYRDDPARKRAEPRFTKLPATWLNAECWTDERTVHSRASPATSHQPYLNPQDPSIYEGEL
jgi:hypothetical protein